MLGPARWGYSSSRRWASPGLGEAAPRRLTMIFPRFDPDGTAHTSCSSRHLEAAGAARGAAASDCHASVTIFHASARHAMVRQKGHGSTGKVGIFSAEHRLAWPEQWSTAAPLAGQGPAGPPSINPAVIALPCANVLLLYLAHMAPGASNGSQSAPRLQQRRLLNLA